MSSAPESRAAPHRDALGRPLLQLRVSVTDRCNFRCRYCMPREHFGPHFVFVPRAELLSFEELTRVVGLLARRGLKKLRLTGGEPLLRRDLPVLIRMLRETTELELALTTNGSLLERHALELARAGLGRVTVSLDSLDDRVFHAMNDTNCSVGDVLRGIEAATQAGLGPVKVNCVVRRGVNDHALVELARHFKGTGHVLRFIEYMDVGTTNGWRLDEVVSGREIVARLGRELALEPLEPNYRGEVARRFRYADGTGEIGVITSVTEPFCGDCTRARLSADGRLFTCLFAAHGTDLRAPLRGGLDDPALDALIERVWSARTDRYSELRTLSTPQNRRIEMSYIGG